MTRSKLVYGFLIAGCLVVGVGMLIAFNMGAGRTPTESPSASATDAVNGPEPSASEPAEPEPNSPEPSEAEGPLQSAQVPAACGRDQATMRDGIVETDTGETSLGETVTAPLREAEGPETVAVVSCTENGSAGDDSLVFYSDQFELLSTLDLREQFPASEKITVSGVKVKKRVVIVNFAEVATYEDSMTPGSLRIKLLQSGEPEVLMTKIDGGSKRFTALMTAARTGSVEETAKYTTTESDARDAIEFFGYLPKSPQTIEIRCDTSDCSVYTVEDFEGMGMIVQVSATVHGSGDQETFSDLFPSTNAG